MKLKSLLILNASAADGRAGEQNEAVQSGFENHFAFADRRTVVVPTHAAVKATARAFASSFGERGVILSGGGAGTLRAVVEGVCAEHDTPPPIGRLSVAPLRLGSGNVLARTFGVSADPGVALAEAAEHVKHEVIRPCTVIRCDVDGRAHFATTLIGLGQFGRIPSDLSRFHERWPRTSRFVADVVGVERRTAVEYRTAMAVRAGGCCVRRSVVEEVDYASPATGERRLRLLAGAIANFPIGGIPLPDVSSAEHPELAGLVLDFSEFSVIRPRIHRVPLSISEGESTTFRLVQPRATPFFLDEDPMTFSRDLRIRIAGMLGIIPGANHHRLESSSCEADRRLSQASTHERSS